MNARLEGHSIFASWVQTSGGAHAAEIPWTYPLGKRSHERRSRPRWNCRRILQASSLVGAGNLADPRITITTTVTYPSPASRLLLSISNTRPPPEPSAPSNASSAPSPSPTSPLSSWHRTTSPIWSSPPGAYPSNRHFSPIASNFSCSNQVFASFLDVNGGKAEDLDLAVVIDEFGLTAPLHVTSATPLLRTTL
ncbi:hypothetical protein BKA70DRAFT_1346694 [Coprinopsis sp. MPI-PUGE-AT-0042]|nr:hypothetical protein BKA70DRAFT_1346694 [Coprinopsis sp. MPI-PUGE-AT-0042]